MENDKDSGELEYDELFSGFERASWEEEPDESEWPYHLFVPKKRPRGILSHTDREFLLGKKEYAHQQSEANRRQEIRERVNNALQDFILLSTLLPEDEREQVFDEEDDPELQGALSATVAFIYQGLGGDIGKLEHIVERGVYFGSNWSRERGATNSVASAKTSIHVERNPDIEEIYSRFRSGPIGHLTPTEIGLLVREGKLSREELQSIAEKDE